MVAEFFNCLHLQHDDLIELNNMEDVGADHVVFNYFGSYWQLIDKCACIYVRFGNFSHT